MLKMHILHLVSMCSQVFPIAATSFDLLSTFFITLTVTSLVIKMSIYVNSFLMLGNIFLQSLKDVNNRWCTISLGIGLAGTPLQGPKLSQGGVKGFKTEQMVRICGRLRSVHGQLHPDFSLHGTRALPHCSSFLRSTAGW